MARQGLEGVKTTGTKTCPQCGQALFADMDVCYGCLHSFALTEGRASGQALSKGHVFEQLPTAESSLWVAEAEDADAWPQQKSQGAEEASMHKGEGTGAGLPTGGHGAHARREGAPAQQASGAPARSDVGHGERAHVKASQSTTGQDATEPNLPMPASPPEGDLTVQLSALTTPSAPPLTLRLQTSVIDVSVPLASNGLSIGRAPDNDVVLHSRAVSRKHLLVEPRADAACVIDLGSTNPALHQGRAVPSELTLPVGDTIDLCGTLITLVAGEGEAALDVSERRARVAAHRSDGRTLPASLPS